MVQQGIPVFFQYFCRIAGYQLLAAFLLMYCLDMEIMYMVTADDKDHSGDGNGHGSKDHYVVSGEINRFDPAVAWIYAEKKDKNKNTQDKKDNACGV